MKKREVIKWEAWSVPFCNEIPAIVHTQYLKKKPVDLYAWKFPFSFEYEFFELADRRYKVKKKDSFLIPSHKWSKMEFIKDIHSILYPRESIHVWMWKAIDFVLKKILGCDDMFRDLSWVNGVNYTYYQYTFIEFWFFKSFSKVISGTCRNITRLCTVSHFVLITTHTSLCDSFTILIAVLMCSARTCHVLYINVIMQ